MAVEYVTHRPVSERTRRTSPVARSFHLCWVMASLAGLAVTSADAQDLDAGKTGPQLFAQDCAACHRSPRGLVKSMSGGSLAGFLRQHYTSSSASANAVAAYVLGAGGGDPRAGQKGDAKQGKQARPTDPTAVGQPGAQPTGRQRDLLARPSDEPPRPPASVPAAAPGPGKKSRRNAPPEAVPAASPEPAAAASPPAEAATAAVPARGPTAAAPTATPGFAEPLP